jgi:DNA-binding FrmR family transcriptional regulator
MEYSIRRLYMATPRLSKSYAADKTSLISRFNKMEGQVRGIRRMVEEDRYCVDVLQQIASLRSAADAIAGIILEDHIRGCVTESVRTGEGDAHIAEVMAVIRRYVRS